MGCVARSAKGCGADLGRFLRRFWLSGDGVWCSAVVLPVDGGNTGRPELSPGRPDDRLGFEKVSCTRIFDDNELWQFGSLIVDLMCLV